MKYLLLILLLLPSWAWGATKYCATDGADSGTAGPFASLEYSLESGGLTWGDTLIVQSGCVVLKSGTNNQIDPSIAAGSGDLVVRSDPGVALDIPASVGTYFCSIPASPTDSQYFTWAVDLTNTGAYGSTIFYAGNSSSFRIGGQAADRGNSPTTIDLGGTSSTGPYYLITAAAGSGTLNIDIYQSIIQNIRLAIVRQTGTAIVPAITYRSSVFNKYGYIYYSNTASTAMNLGLYNTTRYGAWGGGANTGELQFPSASTSVNHFAEYNSIFVANATVPGSFYGAQSVAMADVLANQATKWARSNNVVYSTVAVPDNANGAASTHFNNFWITGSGNYYMPLDKTTWYFNPNFTDAAGGDFSIAAGTSWISGRGLAAKLPAADINGRVWMGNDIGAYQNPAAIKTYPSVQAGLNAVGGDSIAVGTNNSFATLYPTESLITTYPTWNSTGTYAAYGGMAIGGYLLALDVMAANVNLPKKFGLIIGANNGTPYISPLPLLRCLGESAPYSTCASTTATWINLIIDKYVDYANGTKVYPIWLGLGPAKSAAADWDYTNQQSWSDAVNTAVAALRDNFVYRNYPMAMQAATPETWYTGDYQTPSGPGTVGPYYYCLWPHGDCTTSNVHPTTSGYNLIAQEFHRSMPGLAIYGTGGSGFGFNNFGFGW